MDAGNTPALVAGSQGGRRDPTGAARFRGTRDGGPAGEGGKLGGRDLLRICDIRFQGYDLLAVSPVRDLVIDGPDVEFGQIGNLRQSVTEPVRVLRFLCRICDEREIGAVGEPFQHGQPDIRPYPEQRVRPGRTGDSRGLWSWIVPARAASFGRDRHRRLLYVGYPVSPGRRAQKKGRTIWLGRIPYCDRITLNGRLYAVPPVTPTALTPLQTVIEA